METITPTVTSKDGTKIAYDKIGHGSAIILLAGALCSRSFWSGPELAKLLARSLTVYNYDRRGRGESGDTKPYALEREIEDIEAQRAWKEYIKQLTEALAVDRRGDTVALFMELVGTPADQIEAMRHAPVWPLFEALAPTLAYDHSAILGADASVPTGRAANVNAPALVLYGGASFPFMSDTAQALGKAIPHAQVLTLEGQTHDVDPGVLAPVLMEFFL